MRIAIFCVLTLIRNDAIRFHKVLNSARTDKPCSLLLILNARTEKNNYTPITPRFGITGKSACAFSLMLFTLKMNFLSNI